MKKTVKAWPHPGQEYCTAAGLDGSSVGVLNEPGNPHGEGSRHLAHYNPGEPVEIWHLPDGIDAIIRETEWVRQIRFADILTGIGFSGETLVHVQADGSGLQLVRAVSLEDSVKILHACAQLEPLVRPDVAHDACAWET